MCIIIYAHVLCMLSVHCFLAKVFVGKLYVDQCYRLSFKCGGGLMMKDQSLQYLRLLIDGSVSKCSQTSRRGLQALNVRPTCSKPCSGIPYYQLQVCIGCLPPLILPYLPPPPNWE